MPFCRRTAFVLAPLVAALAGAGGVASAEQAHPGSHRGSVFESTSGQSQTGKGSRPVPSHPTDMPTGNVAVAVPLLPNLHSLPGLCQGFLASDKQGKQGHEFQVLLGATGGNAAATMAWCETYLTLWQEGKTGEQ